MNWEKVLARKLCKLEVAEWFLFSMILVYSLVFSYYTILKYYSFRSGAWDLGILVQSVASAARGRFFTNNVELYYSPTGSYFGVHFSPILLILIPFFYLVPTVETILVIQSLILALGSVPTYLIGKHCLKDHLSALVLSATYLLNPSLQGINWYDFHPQTFFPVFILSATYFLKKRKPLYFLFFTVLTLLTVEQASYFMVLYTLYVMWELRADVKKLFSSKKSLLSFLPFITLVIIIVWAVFSSNVKNAINPNPPEELLAVGNYRMLGVRSVMEIPVKVLTNPDLLLKAINFDLPNKILYIVLNFAPTCFLAFLSPMALLPSLLWFFLSILSNWPPYYQFGFQYLAFTLPFILIATIKGVQNLAEAFNADGGTVKRFLFRICLLMLAVSLIISIFASPLSPIHKVGDFRYFRDYGISYPSNLDATVSKVLRSLPEDARILTTSIVFSHITTNINAYVIPPKNSPSERLYTGHLNYLRSIDFDYIFISYFYWDKNQAEDLYNNFIVGSNNFGLFIEGPGLELYKRGYKGPSTKLAIRFSYKELSISDSIVVDDFSSESGKVIMFSASSVTGRSAWFGPYINLREGNYKAIFKIKVDALPSDGKIIKLDVWSNKMQKRIAYLDVFGKDLHKSLTWHTFTLNFNLTTRISDVEFRGVETSSNVTVWLDYIEVYKP
jgi:uncharacterized membrane protein